MKKWKCPACGNLTKTLTCNIVGTCIMDTETEAELNEWEIGNAHCGKCGFKESILGGPSFEVVDA